MGLGQQNASLSSVLASGKQSGTIAESIQGHTTSANSQKEQLVQAWHGKAPAAFETVFADWRRSVLSAVTSLTELGGNVTKSAEIYDMIDGQSQGGFQGLTST